MRRTSSRQRPPARIRRPSSLSLLYARRTRPRVANEIDFGGAMAARVGAWGDRPRGGAASGPAVVPTQPRDGMTPPRGRPREPQSIDAGPKDAVETDPSLRMGETRKGRHVRVGACGGSHRELPRPGRKQRTFQHERHRLLFLPLRAPPMPVIGRPRAHVLLSSRSTLTSDIEECRIQAAARCVSPISPAANPGCPRRAHPTPPQPGTPSTRVHPRTRSLPQVLLP